jgi:glutamate synthase (ferredoxin)
VAEKILNDWKKESLNFVKIMPTEYKLALEKMAKEKIDEIVN